MKRLVLTCLMAVAVAPWTSAIAAEPMDCATLDAAIMAQVLKPEAALRAELLELIPTTVPYQLALQKNPAAATRAFSSSVDGVVAAYGPEWSSNIVKAWYGIGPAKLAKACKAVLGGDYATFGLIQKRSMPRLGSSTEPSSVRLAPWSSWR